MSSESLKAKTIGSLFWKFFERGGSNIVSLLVQIVMARILSPTEFGMLAIMLVFVSLGNMIVQSGFNTALVQTPHADDGDFTTVFWISFIVSLALCFLIWIASPVIAAYYEMPDLRYPLCALSLLLIINAYNSIQVAIVQRSLEFKKIFTATIVSVVLSGVIGILLALNGFGLWALVAQQLIYQLANCIVLSTQVRWRPKFTFKARRAYELFSFGWKMLVGSVIETLYSNVVDLIVGKQFSATVLGFVSQGKKYPATLGAMIDGAIQPVMLAAVSSVQDDISRVRKMTRKALQTSSYLVTPCMATLALVAEPLVRVLLGEQWVPCVWFMQVYCVTQMFSPIHSSNLQAINGLGRSDITLKLVLIKKTYSILFLMLAVLVFDSIYFLIGSYIVSGIISTFVNAYPNKRLLKYGYMQQVKDIFPGVALTAVSVGLSYPISLLNLPDIVTIVAQFAMVVGSYIGFSKLFKVKIFDYLLATAKEVVVLKRG